MSAECLGWGPAPESQMVEAGLVGFLGSPGEAPAFPLERPWWSCLVKYQAPVSLESQIVLTVLYNIHLIKCIHCLSEIQMELNVLDNN